MNEKNFLLFLRFLKNYDAYGGYRKSLNHPIEEIKRLYPINYLRNSFWWGGSKEGDVFWRILHTKWGRSYCGVERDIAYVRGNINSICDYKSYELKNQINE